MPHATSFLTACLLAAITGSVSAAPDEHKLDKAQDYPVGPAKNWFYDESVRATSLSLIHENLLIQRRKALDGV